MAFNPVGDIIFFPEISSVLLLDSSTNDLI